MTAIIAAMHANPQATPMPKMAKHNLTKPYWIKAARTAARITVLGAITLLAACQSSVPRGGRAPNAASKPDPIIIPADGKHRIALLLPITGPDGDVGRSIANATAMALIDTKNTQVSVQTYDTALGVDMAAKRAMNDGSMLILGPLRGDSVAQVAGIARTRNVPIISFSNDASVAGRNVYMLGQLPNQSVDRIVRYAKGRGLNRFAAIVTRNVYGQRASVSVTNSVKNAGGTIVGIQETDGSAASLNAAVQRVKSAGPVDAVLITATGKSAIAAAAALRGAGINAQILGTEQWNVDTSLSGSTIMRGAWFASVSDGFFRQYAPKYRTRYNKTPLRLSSLGYDSILLVGKVAPDWKLGTTFPIRNLTDNGGFIGLDGAFRFQPSGLSERMLEVQEVQGGQFVTIDAAPKTFSN
jgi:branched-chain amino acid transport system substrate-binding protein